MEIPFYTKETIYQLQSIEGLHAPRDSWLVAIDIEALYSSIPHLKDLQITFLNHRGHEQWEYNEFVLELLEFSLTKNAFTFNGIHYLQVQSVAMETCCAPSYFNPYLGRYKNHNFREDASSMYRYINKVLIIWDDTNNALDYFVACLNMKDLNIKINVLCDRNQISFLVSWIYNKEGGRPGGKTLYYKSTVT